ncbi:MAG: transglutaminase family protein [Phycisphaerae bacterium]
MFLCFLLYGPVAASDKPINYLDPPQGRFIDDWMIVELSGAKAGYAHSTMSREGDEIATSLLTIFKLGRAERAVSVRMEQSTRETVAGVPLSFETVMQLGRTAMKTRGRIQAGEVQVISSQFGFDTRQTAKLPEGALMAWGVFRASIEHGFEPGTTYDLYLYEPSMRVDGPVKARTVVGERVKIDHLGVKRDAFRVVSTIEIGAGEVDSVAFVDDQGQVLQAETSLGGFVLKFIRVDRATALKEFDAPEFLVNTLVEIDQAIDRAAAKRIVYELRVSGAQQEIPKLPDTSMQSTRDHSGKSVIVDVRRLDHDALSKAVVRSEDIRAATVRERSGRAEMEEFLAATPALNSKDELLVRMSQEAAGDAASPYAVADKLRVYVSDVIVDKNLNIGFATASEVCRKREGDCTEHAVLLAALGRARGIPSRVVVGLAYVPAFVGKKNVFGFHMWTQFHIGGRWIDFDAALGETDCSPARIALATSSLKDTAVGEMALPILDLMTGLNIEIKSIETR